MSVRLPMPPRRSAADDDDLTVVLVDHPARRIGRLQPHAADSVGGQDVQVAGDAGGQVRCRGFEPCGCTWVAVVVVYVRINSGWIRVDGHLRVPVIVRPAWIRNCASRVRRLVGSDHSDRLFVSMIARPVAGWPRRRQNVSRRAMSLTKPRRVRADAAWARPLYTSPTGDVPDHGAVKYFSSKQSSRGLRSRARPSALRHPAGPPVER